MIETLRALAVLAEPPSDGHAHVARALGLPGEPSRADYTSCFVFQLYPYASVYLGAEGMLGGEARDRVAGFWRAVHLSPPAEPDHLSTLLAFYASLGEAAQQEREPLRRDALVQARRALLHEHLASWLPAYLLKLDLIASPLYRAWGKLLGDVLREEVRATGGELDRLPRHLAEAPALPGPDAGLRELLQTLLAPARTGMVLVRDDLRRAARQLGLGARTGERRFVLESMLAQDAPATLGWLAEEARLWARWHGPASGGATGRHWAARAARSADWLDELAGQARRARDPQASAVAETSVTR